MWTIIWPQQPEYREWRPRRWYITSRIGSRVHRSGIFSMKRTLNLTSSRPRGYLPLRAHNFSKRGDQIDQIPKLVWGLTLVHVTSHVISYSCKRFWFRVSEYREGDGRGKCTEQVPETILRVRRELEEDQRRGKKVKRQASSWRWKAGMVLLAGPKRQLNLSRV